MEKNKQIQESGDNSQQFMANTLIVNNNGLTEQQVRAIINGEIANTLKENQLVANDIALKRLNEFEDILLPKLVKNEMLDLFKEPAVQILFKNAQRTAICSKRKLDYELLSELLIHRTKNNNINKSVAISNAVEIIDKITEDALLVLTIFHAVECFSPIDGNIEEGFKVLDELFGKILQGTNLPNNDEWIENLEINRIISFNTIGNTKKISDFWFEEFTSYSQIWIKKDSEEFYKLCQEFKDNNLPMNIIIDNPLDTNFKTLKILKKEQINNLSITKVISEPKQSVNIQIPITEKQKNVITSIFDNNKFKNNGNNNEKILFEQKLNEYKNLKYINEWWNKYITKFSIRLNSIGKVIAHTNVKNMDPSLPDLD